MSTYFLNDNAQTLFFLSREPSVAAIAGFGSGKTFASWLKIFKWAVDHPNIMHGYFAPTYGLIRDIFYPMVEAFCEEEGIDYEIKRGEDKVYLQGLSPIICRSMQHPETIVGFEIGNAAVDEIDILPAAKAWQAWRKIKARCRSKMYEPGKKKKPKNEISNQMALASTPEGFKFAYEAFKKNPLPGSAIFQMSTYDNKKNLPKGYIDELMSNYPPQLIDAYIRGHFVNMVAMPVWGAYNRQLNRSKEEVKKGEHLAVGMDFNVGRGCAVVYVARDGILHAADEIVNSYDTPDTIRVLKDRYPDHGVTVFPDASGNSRKSVNATTTDIALLKQAGFGVKVNNRNPAIKERVTATNAMFHNGKDERRLFVNDSRCPNFADALEQQVYDDNGLPEKGDGKFDDITDSGSYPIAYLYPIKQRVTSAVGIGEII